MRCLILLLLLISVSFGDDERIIFLLDTSGSMAGQEVEMVQSVNNQLEKMNNVVSPNGSVFEVLIYTFSTGRALLLESNLAASPRIRVDQYVCDGATALFDAVAETLERDAKRGSTIIIATDGQDNSSSRSSQEIREMLEKARTTNDIEVIYIAKGEEAWEQSRAMGIPGPQGVRGASSETLGVLLGGGAATIAVSATAFRHVKNE